MTRTCVNSGGEGGAVLFQHDFSVAGAWPSMTEVVFTDNGNTHTRSIVTPTALSHAAVFGSMGRITVTGVGGSDRRGHIFNDAGVCTDVEIYAEFMSKNIKQLGLVLRVDAIGDAVNQNAYVMSTDAIFAVPNQMQLSVWKGLPAVTNLAVGGQLESMLNLKPILSSSLTANVASLVLTGGHDVRTGDFLDVKTASGLDDQFQTAMATPTPGQVQYAKTHADIAVAGAGWMGNLSRCYPAALRGRVVGRNVAIKAWRLDKPEPSWLDPGAVVRWVDTGALANGFGPTQGKVGLLVCHGSAGQFDDFGLVQIRELLPSDAR